MYTHTHIYLIYLSIYPSILDSTDMQPVGMGRDIYSDGSNRDRESDL